MVRAMRYEELLVYLQNLNMKVVPTEDVRVRGYDLETYKKLAKRTETIDYDCDFHNGTCKGMLLGGGGCCHHCAPGFGYWRKESGALDEASIRAMAEYFDPHTGFMRAGVGCILPRELRSPTCLYVFCSEDEMSGEDREVLYRIQFGANWSKS